VKNEYRKIPIHTPDKFGSASLPRSKITRKAGIVILVTKTVFFCLIYLKLCIFLNLFLNYAVTPTVAPAARRGPPLVYYLQQMQITRSRTIIATTNSLHFTKVAGMRSISLASTTSTMFETNMSLLYNKVTTEHEFYIFGWSLFNV
jgi:hypothetical protein